MNHRYWGAYWVTSLNGTFIKSMPNVEKGLSHELQTSWIILKSSDKENKLTREI